MTSKKIQEEINKLIEIKEKIIRVENIETKDINLLVFKKYLEIENVEKVSKYINELGYRKINKDTEKEAKYDSNDITEIINKKNSIDDEWLHNQVKKMFNAHKKAIIKGYY